MEYLFKIFFLITLICYSESGFFSKVKDMGVDSTCILTIKSEISQLVVNDTLKIKDPEITMNTQEIIKHRGYPVNVYNVTTEDGYILELIRIPNSPNKTSANSITSKYPIYIQHGLMQDSSCGVINPNPTSIAFWFVEKGYDVFLGNARGTVSSRQHETLDPDMPGEFWDYTFHEKGIYDVPAFVDKILNITGQSKLTYIGHSEGTTDFFVAASMKPEFNDKIIGMFALGPAAVISNVKPSTKFICTASYITQQIPKSGHVEFRASSKLISGIAKLLCDGANTGNILCETMIFAILGFNYNSTEKRSLASLIAHSSQGVSVKEIQHFCQSTVSGKFRRFDYGLLNSFHYNSFSPPEYDLSNIKSKVFLFCGTCDSVTTPGDCKNLAKKLPNVTVTEIPLYNHGDYLFANNNYQIFSKIHEQIKKLIPTM